MKQNETKPGLSLEGRVSKMWWLETRPRAVTIFKDSRTRGESWGVSNEQPAASSKQNYSSPLQFFATTLNLEHLV